jgi:hypothetical protein
MEKANSKQTIFNSKPFGVTAWIFLENSAIRCIPLVSSVAQVVEADVWQLRIPQRWSEVPLAQV